MVRRLRERGPCALRAGVPRASTGRDAPRDLLEPGGEASLRPPTRETAWLVALLLGAAALRVFIAGESVPHNAYDDHLEPIAYYATHRARPAADACWQCYQPPAYYALASGVLRATSAATGDNQIAWRAVQSLSVLFSLATLALIWRILALAGSRDLVPRVCAFTVVAFLPREVTNAVFVSNDAMLSFGVALAIWIFVEALARESQRPSPGWLMALLGASALAAWTKQHGLLVVLLPIVLVARPGPFGGSASRPRALTVAVLAAGLLLIAAEPAYQRVTTGHWLVSNQHYFDWPSVQRPGSLADASFTDFRIVSLFAEPMRSTATIDSYWTQLFAKLWFDYDPKLLVDAPSTRALGAAWYGMGLVLCSVWALGAAVAARRWWGRPQLALLVLQAAYVAVPLVQSLRFPYYSSMKATFFLPALPVSALLLCLGVERLGASPRARMLCVSVCAVIPLLFLWECVLVHEQIRDAMLSSLRRGQLWPFPPGWGSR